MGIHIINGPNLNLVGQREPEIYGWTSLNDYLEGLAKDSPVPLTLFQSNVEGEIINRLQEVGFTAQGIILNAGGYTHTSVAIADAVAAIPAPVVEVHLTNIFTREPERQVSLLSKHVIGIIAGFGPEVYRLALDYLIHRINRPEGS